MNINNCICIRCKEHEPLEECIDCEDYKAGICNMSDAYKQGWHDALAWMDGRDYGYRGMNVEVE